MSAPHVTVGARKVLLSDVAAVAVNGARVDLDPATLRNCDDDAKARHKGVTAVLAASELLASRLSLDESDALDETDARAAIFARIVSLMQGRSGVGAEAIELLTQLLNTRVTPLLPRARAAADEGAAIVSALLGAGLAFYGGATCPLAEAMAAAGLKPLKTLLPREAASLRLQSFAARGQAAAAAAAAAKSLAAATAVAALSCEATRAFTEPFEAVHFDICRQHRGQMVEAEGLRLLLANSQLVNSRGAGGKAGGKAKGAKKGAAGGGDAAAAPAEGGEAMAAAVLQDHDAIRAVPQYHGPAREAVLAAGKALETELNSAEAGPLDREATSAGPFHPQQVSSAVTSLNHAVGLLASGSLQRADLVRAAAAASAAAAATGSLPTPPAAAVASAEDGAAPAGAAAAAAPRGSGAFSRNPGFANGFSSNGCGRYEPADFDGLYEETSMLSLDEMSSTLASALRTLGQALAGEAAAALAALRAEDERAAAAAAAEADAKAAARAARPLPQPATTGAAGGADAAAAAAAADGEASGAGDDKRQRVKTGKAAEKAAEKAAAKAAKKGGGGGGKGGGGVLLGSGTSELRAWLLRQAAGTAAAAGAAALPSAEVLERAMDPWNCGVEVAGFGAVAAALWEKLGSGGTQRKPKIAKGTRDFGPEQMLVREKAFAAIRRVFKRHGAVEIDTPVFELKETLTGKYGEDSKLIYDLADQGGELLALRYDLTVPFARFLALNSVGNIKRYHIAKVYRRDQPNLQRGRFREFYQCDFDVAGNYGTMVADAEVVSVACEILSALPIGKFEVKLNHRRLLDAVLDLCGCPAEKTRSICSAVDKLDKLSWEEVRCEMVEEKGLAAEVADRVGTFVTYRGEPHALWRQLTEERAFGDHPEAAAAMAELKLLFDYLEALGTLHYVSFDLSLARGLDYYTGLIYECVVMDGETKVGSIAAGGRYDRLVGMFSPGEQQVPCVGVSIGVERVLAIMESRSAAKGTASKSNVQVFVASIGAGLLPLRMRIARLLWEADVSAEYAHQENPKLKRQLDEVLERGIPFMVIAGEDEAARGVLKIKDMEAHTEEELPIADVAAALLARGCATVAAQAALAPVQVASN